MCLDKVIDILNNVKILCKNSGSEIITLSLYTFAIEEYGKYLLLKKCFENNINQDKIDVDTKIFRAHKLKFDAAINDLPEECLAFVVYNIKEIPEIIPDSLRKEAENLRRFADNYNESHPNVTMDASVTLPYDFETRKNLLYVEWVDKVKKWGYGIRSNDVKYVYEDNIEKEIELEDDEKYPQKHINAIELFGNHIQKKA